MGNAPIDVAGNGGDRKNRGQGNINGKVGKIQNFGDITCKKGGRQNVVGGNMRDSSASASKSASASDSSQSSVSKSKS